MSGTIAAVAACSDALRRPGEPGFQPLFNGTDLAGWTEIGSQGAWSVVDGVIECNGRTEGYAWLCTQRKYSDFILKLEWRIPERCNTGVFCRVPQREGRASLTGFEVQIADDRSAPMDGEVSGSIFRRVPARVKAARPIGQWNELEITCLGTRVRVVLNGQTTADFDMATVPGMENVPSSGYIGLQNHGHPVAFRNVRIREISQPGR